MAYTKNSAGKPATLSASEGEYLFDNAHTAAGNRMTALEALLDPGTVRRLTTELGVREGWRCMEVGAGCGSVARWLAKRVGPSGHVLATDLDLRWFHSEQLANLECRRHDIRTDPLPGAAFDLIHARLVLVHLPGREEVLGRLVAALKPGGVLLLEDFDELLPNVPDSESPYAAVANRMRGAFNEILRRAGANTKYPRTLPRLMAGVGLVEFGFEGDWVCYRGGSPGALLERANTIQLRDQLVQSGLVSDADIQQFLQALDSPEFVGSVPLLIAAWGRCA